MKTTRLPGLLSWSLFQPDRGIDFNGFFWRRPEGRGGLMIDPLALDEAGLATVREAGGVADVLVTNFDHLRAAPALKEAFGARVLAPAEERERFGDRAGVVDAWFGDELPEDLRADVQVFPIRGGKSPVEAALYLRPLKALYFSDLVRSHASGALILMKDEKLADKQRVLDDLRRVLPLPFEAVLLGDGDCVWTGARDALCGFLEALPGTLFNRINLDRLEWVRRDAQPGAVSDRAQVSRYMTLRQLGFHMARLHPGSVSTAFHYETGEEEIFLVLEGRLTARTPQGEFELGPGDLVGFPPGPANAHQFRNDSDEPCTFLCLGNDRPQSLCFYPDTQKINVCERGELYRVADRRSDYWEGDPTVGRDRSAK
ncbi:MAG: cupin domain-containing protein [Planctomycetota bacterium]